MNFAENRTRKRGGGFGPSKGVLDFVAFIELPTKATPREEWVLRFGGGGGWRGVELGLKMGEEVAGRIVGGGRGRESEGGGRKRKSEKVVRVLGVFKGGFLGQKGEIRV